VRNVRISILVAVAAVVSAALAGSALSAVPRSTAGKQVKIKIVKIAFVGSYSGQASTKIDQGSTTAAILANGNGNGKLIGGGTIVGSGSADSSQQPCPPFGGTGKITGIKGAIFFTVVSGAKGCGDDGGHNFSLVGYLSVTKATGVLKKAKGQLRFTGSYSRDDGTFAIKLTGTLKQPKPVKTK
jgi:hypothetical protein